MLLFLKSLTVSRGKVAVSKHDTRVAFDCVVLTLLFALLLLTLVYFLLVKS